MGPDVVSGLPDDPFGKPVWRGRATGTPWVWSRDPRLATDLWKRFAVFASESMEIAVPTDVAYREWARFESFPRWVDGLVGRDQFDEATFNWAAHLDPRPRTADTAIVAEEPHQRIGWLSTRGPEQLGSVTFSPRGPATCRVTVELEYDPGEIPSGVGDQLGFVAAVLSGCLLEFDIRVKLRCTRGADAPRYRRADTTADG